MNLFNEPFEKIRNGSKTIELRLYDSKRQLVKECDEIMFTNINTKETILVKVIAIHRFSSFAELYNALPLDKCGYGLNDTKDPADMDYYYSKEEQEIYGVVGIEIKVIT